MKFDKPEKDRVEIDTFIRESNKRTFGNPNVRRIYFPFLDPHPVGKKVFTTNARADETFDQAGFFLGAKEKRLPNDLWKAEIKPDRPDGFDYGVFDFSDLFARATMGKAYQELTKEQKNALGKKFEHSVSDHLPIWIRLPRPGFAPAPTP